MKRNRLAVILVAMATSMLIVQGALATDEPPVLGPEVAAMEAATQEAEEHRGADLEEISANRDAVIEELVQIWFMDEPGWEEEFSVALSQANDSELLAILNAKSYPEAQAILSGGTPDDFSAASFGTPFALGDTDKDFVYTPVDPCRIIDTRLAGGKISTNTSRNFNVHGGASLLIPQGGNPAGCTAPRGEPRAVHMNIVAVDSTALGFLTVWTKGASRPLAGVITYEPGKNDPISNAFTVQTGYLQGQDISVYAFRTTHVVADVMGYYYDVIDAPGFDYSQTVGSFTPISTSMSSPTQLRSATLTCPAVGWIVAQATAYAWLYSSSNSPTAVPWLGISLNTTAVFDGNIAAYEGDKQGANVSAGDLIGVHSLSKEYVWNCSAGQSITIFMTAIQSGAGAATRILQPTLVLKYFSSRY